MFDLDSFQRDCLVVIAGLGESVGLDIATGLEEYYGQQVNHGQLYPNLDTLEEMSLVERKYADPRTSVYSLTEQAEREMRDHFEWIQSALDRTVAE